MMMKLKNLKKWKKWKNSRTAGRMDGGGGKTD
jgi:hypothetical protein